MSLLYDKVVNTINKPPDQRQAGEIEQILPWFRKKSDLFQSLHTDIVRDIVKNCDFTKCKRDTVIIRQMDEGDCFYIILSGSVAIHINTTLTEEEFPSVKQSQLDEEDAVENDEKKERKLDRSKYGIYVGKIDAGKSFGELALINADCVRNATIIADEATDLLSVGRHLYNRSLRAFQANEFEERKEFVRTMPLFHSWQTRYKKMMAMSLKKMTLKFEDTIVRQGAPVDGIHFVIQGQVKIRLDPSHHQTQYPHMYPLGDIADLEKEKARELLRIEMNLERQRTADHRSTYQRRAMPQSEAKKSNLKPLELCLARAVDTIGDMEMAMGLNSYSQTVECTEESIIYHLDQRNYDRLIEKRNPGALEMLRDIVHTKLTLHFNRLPGDSIPLYRFFLYMLDEKEKDNRRSSRSRGSKTPHEMQVNVDNLQKGPLVNLYGPGSVFYLIRKRAKEMAVRQRRRGNLRDGNIRFGAPSKTFNSSKGLLPLSQNPAMTYNNTFIYNQNQSEPSALAQDTATGALLNLYDLQQDTHVLQQGEDEVDYMDDSREGYYVDEGFGPLDIEDGYDWASSDSALCRLEERMSQWHSSLGTVHKGKCVVRLRRYQFEDENRPKPGNKVYVKVRSKPKNVSFFAFQSPSDDESPDGVDGTDGSGHGSGGSGGGGQLRTAAPNSRSPITSMRLLDYVTSDKANDVMCDAPERPQTCVGIQRPNSSKSEPPRSAGHKQRKRKQYTVAEYQALKAELRQKQKAFVSLLPRRSHTVL